MVVAKACPVVLRDDKILAFAHPLAGWQLVKGTVEPGEEPGAAAVRELGEEAGVEGRIRRELGQSEQIDQGQIWHFFLVEAGDLPDQWIFRCADDGGHDFAFFWHRLDEEPGSNWHPIFPRALAFIRQAL